MENMTKKFAKAVLDRRKQLGLTQEELARMVGTSKQMVSKYELGQRSPKIIMARAFATALGTTLDELLDIEKIEEEQTEAPKTAEARILATGIDKLPKEQREQALNVIKAMFAKYSSYFEEEDKNET